MFKRGPIPLKYKIMSRLWPPFLGANIRCTKLTPDSREIETRMKLRWYNRNWVGTHYGGSLFSMTDPFYMFMLIRILGRDYRVWDKSTCIEFKKPGTTEMVANFHIPQEKIDEIIENTKTGDPYYVKFNVNVMDTDEEVVASVEKLIYVRKRKGK